VLNCWICAKIAKWLQGVNNDTFEDWQKKALQVEYFDVQRGVAATPSADVVLFAFLIRLSRYAHNGERCWITVCFVPSDGMFS